MAEREFRKAANASCCSMPGGTLNISFRIRFLGWVGLLGLGLGACAVQDINLRNTEAHARAGIAAEQAGDWDAARRQFAQAVVNADLGGAQAMAKAPINYQYGRALGVVCSWDLAEKYLLRSRHLVEEAGQSPYLPVLELALLNQDRHQFGLAANYYGELLALVEKEHLLSKFPLGVADINDGYADTLDATGRPAEAAARRAAAQSIRDEYPGAKPAGTRTPYGSHCPASPEAMQGNSDPTATEVATAWRSRLDSELPIGSRREAVLAWAAKNHISLGEGKEPGQLIVPIGYVKETPPASSLPVSRSAVCDGWGVSASLDFNSAGELVKREVRTLGNCL